MTVEEKKAYLRAQIEELKTELSYYKEHDYDDFEDTYGMTLKELVELRNSLRGRLKYLVNEKFSYEEEEK